MNPEIVYFLSENPISTYIMLLAWVSYSSICCFIAYRTKMLGLLVSAGGALPKIIFYLYKLLHVWDTSPLAILYSRVADLTIVISLMLSLWFMWRSIRGRPI